MVVVGGGGVGSEEEQGRGRDDCVRREGQRVLQGWGQTSRITVNQTVGERKASGLSARGQISFNTSTTSKIPERAQCFCI